MKQSCNPLQQSMRTEGPPYIGNDLWNRRGWSKRLERVIDGDVGVGED